MEKNNKKRNKLTGKDLTFYILCFLETIIFTITLFVFNLHHLIFYTLLGMSIVLLIIDFIIRLKGE